MKMTFNEAAGTATMSSADADALLLRLEQAEAQIAALRRWLADATEKGTPSWVPVDEVLAQLDGAA